MLPLVEEIDRQDFDLVVRLMRKSGELGLLMAEIPEEHGGLELDKVSGMLVAEKMGAAGALGATFMAHAGIGTLPLVYYGTAEQKGRYLDKLGSGEWLAAYCLTEPDSGSDALGAKTTATLSDDGSCYILNGAKQFITNAAFADLFTVFAKIDKTHFTGFLLVNYYEEYQQAIEEYAAECAISKVFCSEVWADVVDEVLQSFRISDCRCLKDCLLKGEFPFQPLAQNSSGDQHAVNLVGALIDPADARIAIKALCRILADKTVAAVNLHGSK